MTPTYEEVQELIIDRISYTDTGIFWANWCLNRDELNHLKQYCEGVLWPSYEEMKWHPFWVCKLVIQRPRVEIYEYFSDVEVFNDMLEPNHRRRHVMLNQVQWSLDLITRTKKDAYKVKRYFLKYLIKQRPKKQKANTYKNTTYSSGNFGRGNIIAQYCDKPSKVNGLPCHHIEFRSTGVETVRQSGVNGPEDMINFDFLAFWKKRLIIEELNFDFAATIVEKLHRRVGRPKTSFSSKSTTLNPERRAKVLALRKKIEKTRHLKPLYRMMRLERYKDAEGKTDPALPPGASLDLRRYLRSEYDCTPYQLRKCFRRMDNDPFLPK